MSSSLLFFLTFGSLLFTACTIGPDYRRPDEKLPQAFKKGAATKGKLPQGDPFSEFKDPEMDKLLIQAEENCPTLAAALARIDQSRALLGISRADQAPALVADLIGQQFQNSRNTFNRSRQGTSQDFQIKLNLSYEVDLWGRIRREVQRAKNQLSASEADYHSALLSLKSDVARNYLSIRALDSELSLLNETVALRQQRLNLTHSLFTAGSLNELDVSRATTEYESLRAEVTRIQRRRGELENSLAALAGRFATDFELRPRSELRARTPRVPVGVPSDLLRRRPDIIAAERRLAARSEEIGIAISKYLPRLTLTGIGGVQAVETNDLFDSQSTLYSAGAGIIAPIFLGSRIKSDKLHAQAAYREALSNYRQTLLTAVRDTENGLLSTRLLKQTVAMQNKASTASARAAELTRARYDKGLDSLFEVIETERSALEQERLFVRAKLASQLAAINLIKAIGGGWKK